MMILKCTNILPPPPQHHNSNITNFFLSDFSVWSIGPKIVAYQSCLCRLRVQRNANYERHAQHHVLPNCGREHCLLQLQAYTQIPSCRKISGGLIAQVALLPFRGGGPPSPRGTTPSWDQGRCCVVLCSEKWQWLLFQGCIPKVLWIIEILVNIKQK